MKVEPLPNPALHLSEAEPPYVRVVGESGEWRPDVSTRALRMIAGGGAGEGEEASSRAAAELLNGGAKIGWVRSAFIKLQAALGALSSVGRAEADVSPSDAETVCLALGALIENLEGAYQGELKRAVAWAGAAAAAMGDFPADILVRLAGAGSDRALEELLKNDPSHPRIDSLLELWASSPHPDRLISGTFGSPRYVSRFPLPSNPRLWEAAGRERREAALDGSMSGAIGAWLGVNHLEFRPKLFARLAYRAPIWAARMLRCAQRPEQLEEAARNSSGDIREVALAHLNYLRGEPLRAHALRWPIRQSGVPWVPTFLSRGGMDGSVSANLSSAGSVLAVARQWEGGAAWLRFGEDAVWAADCRCNCGAGRGEYMLPYSPGAEDRLELMLASPRRGEWPPPPLLRSRYVKPDGMHYRIWVEDPDNVLREGMCVETEHHVRGEISYETVLATERGEGGHYGEIYRAEG